MQHNAILIKPYQVNSFYSKQIDKLSKCSPSSSLQIRIYNAYTSRNISELRNLYKNNGPQVLRYIICLALSVSKNFNLAKYFLKYELENVPKYEIHREHLIERYERKKLLIDIFQESDFIQWDKLFFKHNHDYVEFKIYFKVEYFNISKKEKQNNFELSQLEFLHIPFKKVEERYAGKIMLKNCIYLLASDIMTERNISRGIVIDFQKSKLCIEDLKFQTEFIQKLIKLDKNEKQKAKKFIDKFMTIATDRQKFLLNKLILKIGIVEKS